MCGGIREKINKQGSNKERADVAHKKIIIFLKNYIHCQYTKVRQNYFPFEQLSALVYTPRCQPRDFRPMF